MFPEYGNQGWLTKKSIDKRMFRYYSKEGNGIDKQSLFCRVIVRRWNSVLLVKTFGKPGQIAKTNVKGNF